MSIRVSRNVRVQRAKCLSRRSPSFTKCLEPYVQMSILDWSPPSDEPRDRVASARCSSRASDVHNGAECPYWRRDVHVGVGMFTRVHYGHLAVFRVHRHAKSRWTSGDIVDNKKRCVGKFVQAAAQGLGNGWPRQPLQLERAVPRGCWIPTQKIGFMESGGVHAKPGF